MRYQQGGADDRRAGEQGQMAQQHATKMVFGQAINLCDDARRHLAEQADLSTTRSGFTLRWWTTAGATCEDCQAVLAYGPKALPAPTVIKGAPVKSKLMDEIVADMRRNPRYRDRIDEPEWAIESYR